MSVAKLSLFTPTVTHGRVCGWMSVRQLMAYHSLVVLHKTLLSPKSVYLYQKVTSEGKFPFKTRQAASCPPGFSFEVSHPTDSRTVRQRSSTKLGLSKKGWCWKSVELYNTLPTDLRLERKLPSFKKRLKKWVATNVSI